MANQRRVALCYFGAVTFPAHKNMGRIVTLNSDGAPAGRARELGMARSVAAKSKSLRDRDRLEEGRGLANGLLEF